MYIYEFGCILISIKFSETYIEDFKAGNIEYTNEVDSLLSSLKSDVTLLDQEFEDTIEETLSNGTYSIGYLVDVSALGYEFITDLYLGLAEALVEISTINTEKLTNGITGLK